VEENAREKSIGALIVIQAPAVELLKKRPTKSLVQFISQFEHTEVVEGNPEKISWWNLSINTNTEAVELLKQNPDKIDWANLSGNTNAECGTVETEPDKISWIDLSSNANAKRWRVEGKPQQNQLELFIA
jgi:ribosomal protein L24E